MGYRDERDALRAKVESLEQALDKAKADEIPLFPKRSPGERRLRAAITAGVLLTIVGGGAGVWAWTKRAADQAVAVGWSKLSSCLVGDPLAPGEPAARRVRRIRLAYASAPRDANGRWPARCQVPAHDLYETLRDAGRAAKGENDVAHWAEALAAGVEQGAREEQIDATIEHLYEEAAKSGLVATPAVGVTPAPAPAKPLDLAGLAGAVVTRAEVAASSLYTEMLPGIDRHVVVEGAPADAAELCSLSAAKGNLTCRPLPAALAHKRGLRLIGATDAGAAPLIFAGRDGEDGIYRSDTGELVASVRAHSGYAAADGYVAIQTWPSLDDGHFDVIEQRRPGAEITRTAVKVEAQREIQPVTSIHRSKLLWDKAILQMLDGKKLDRPPWVAFKTLGKEPLGGAFHRIGDLNWVNTNVLGCRGTNGVIARFGPSDAMLLFNDGDRWQGPVAARGLGDIMRCDGADAVFVSSWPPRATRCTPAGCDEQGAEKGAWPTLPTSGTSTVAYDLVGGKVLVAWVTEREGVRVRVAPAAQIGKTEDVVIFDDLVGADGQAARASVLSGLRVMAAGGAAVVFVATSAGMRAIRVDADGSFRPAEITR